MRVDQIDTAHRGRFTRFAVGAAVAALLTVATACGDGDDGPTATAPPGGGATLPSDPVGDPSEADAAALVVGKSEAEAEAAVTDQGWVLRVVTRDGEDLPGTDDFRPERVNVEVADGIVVAVVSIG